jgi:hypothetical protein
MFIEDRCGFIAKPYSTLPSPDGRRGSLAALSVLVR